MGLVNNNSGIAPVIEGCCRLLIFTVSSIMFAIAVLSLHYLVDDFDDVNLNSFSSIIGIVFAALIRFFQVITLFILMCDMTLITYKPFGQNYVKSKDKFIEIFRINRLVLLSFMMLVGATVKSVSYEKYLNQELVSSSIQGVYRQLELQQQQTPLPYQPLPHDFRRLQDIHSECDESGFNTAFPDDSTENDILTDPNRVAGFVMFSRVTLFVLGTMLFLFVAILRILENKFNYNFGNITRCGGNEQSDHDRSKSWTSPSWYERHPNYLNRDQKFQDKLHFGFISLQPLAAFALEVSMLIVGLRDINFRPFLDSNSHGQTMVQFAITHLAAMVMSLILFLNIFKTVLKRKQQIVHFVQYVMGVYLLSQASSNFLLFFEAANFSEKRKLKHQNIFHRKISTSAGEVDYPLLVILSSLVILLLPVVIYIIFETLKCRRTCQSGGEERTGRRNHTPFCDSFTDGTKDGIKAIAKNATDPWKLYRTFHCLSLLCGVASIITASLSWASPIASVSIETGSTFSGLYDGVEEIERQLNDLAEALSSMHLSLDPCGKKVSEASNTDILLKSSLKSGKNSKELFKECFDDEGNWKDGIQQGSDDGHDYETNCTELQEGSKRLDDAIEQRNSITDPSQYNSTTQELEVCPIPDFDEPEMPDNVDKTCEQIACGVFFGTMVALTAATAVPFAGAGAAAAKVAARIARKTIIFGKRLGKTAKTVKKTKGNVVKAARILAKVAGRASSLAFYAEYQFLWALAPVFAVGFFCIFIGFGAARVFATSVVVQ